MADSRIGSAIEIAVRSPHRMIYFDHNASSPLIPEARDAWLNASQRFPGNPSSPHRVGSRAEAALDEARTTVAKIVGCSPLDLVWTSGATEASNTVFHHYAAAGDSGAEVWISAIEHPCVLEAAAHYFGNRVRLIPVLPSGVVDLTWLGAALKSGKRPVLAAVMAANNETGVLQPWREALQLCRDAGVPLLCDAVQWLGKLSSEGLSDCDFLIGSAHKFGGPKGSGFLKCPSGVLIRSLLKGGPQEDRRRAGTENVPGALATAAALTARSASIARGEQNTHTAWRDAFERDIAASLPGLAIVGQAQPRLWNTTAALMPDLPDCRQRWVVKLDRLGYAASTGSACASGKEAPSHVLSAMGYGASEAGRVLRFSSGWETTPEEWQALAQGVKQCYAKLMELQPQP